MPVRARRSHRVACGCWGVTKSLQLNIVLLLAFFVQHIVVARLSAGGFFSKAPR